METNEPWQLPPDGTEKGEGYTDSNQEKKINFHPVNRFNWEAITKLSVEEDQKGYIPNNLFSLAQCAYEGGEPYAIYFGSELVGFMVISIFSDIPWITRIMIDKEKQGNGYAFKALNTIINNIKQKTGVYEIRTSIARKNALAEHLFSSVGFKRKADIDAKEFTMVYYCK